jgi:glutamyl-tRNA(Gln) amidotransferase subunit E
LWSVGIELLRLTPLSQEGEDGTDYKAMKLKVGIELHQQLSTTHKLFCNCPPYNPASLENLDRQSFDGRIAGGASSSKDANFRPQKDTPKDELKFMRILRPTTSELGEMDVAAKFESRRLIKVVYVAGKRSSCLVEADEEPPHPLNEEALESGILFSLALGSRIVDEVHVMRKIVVDGSNTSGFQRTAVIALGGGLSFRCDEQNDGDSMRYVRVQTVTLEEDAARALDRSEVAATDEDARMYALDRLGTPLVEVALEPIEGSPEDVEKAARSLGRLMRSTGRVARGLGSIRQDINMSVMDGKVVEVKGVQKLDMLSKVIKYEALRQKFLFDLAGEIRKLVGGSSISTSIHDVTSLFSETKSEVLKRSLHVDHPTSIYCVIAEKIAGYIGKENTLHYRVGKELGAIARTYGLGGVIHSDELPAYGITEDEVRKLKLSLGMSERDAFVLLSGETLRVQRASEAISNRLKELIAGTPAETRGASQEGETFFLRPRPGAARMYPETDIPLIKISKDMIKRLEKEIPEPWEKLVKSFSEKYDLPKQVAEPLFDSERKEIFEEVVEKTKLSSRFVASVLVDMFQSLEREGMNVQELSNDLIKDVFLELDRGTFAKEALQEVLRLLCTLPEEEKSVDRALEKAGLKAMSVSDLRNIIDGLIKENEKLVRERREDAKGMLMGKIMKLARGRVDGKIVSDVLTERLQSYLTAQELNAKGVG